MMSHMRFFTRTVFYMSQVFTVVCSNSTSALVVKQFISYIPDSFSFFQEIVWLYINTTLNIFDKLIVYTQSPKWERDHPDVLRISENHPNLIKFTIPFPYELVSRSPTDNFGNFFIKCPITILHEYTVNIVFKFVSHSTQFTER